MKISTKGRYSVTALYELAQRYGEGPVSLKCVAQGQGLSENYLEQLMVPLRRAGIVQSIRGSVPSSPPWKGRLLWWIVCWLKPVRRSRCVTRHVPV